jgi:hypothetical protein
VPKNYALQHIRIYGRLDSLDCLLVRDLAVDEQQDYSTDSRDEEQSIQWGYSAKRGKQSPNQRAEGAMQKIN